MKGQGRRKWEGEGEGEGMGDRGGKITGGRERREVGEGEREEGKSN